MTDHRLRILLVDDDRDLLDLLKYIFRKDGFQVKTVSKAKQVISAALAFLPELIVLDVLMPDGNGIDLCKEMRQIESLKDTFIFVLDSFLSHAKPQ